MLPDQYDEYSKVFDLFSDSRIFPVFTKVNQYILGTIFSRSNASRHIADLGAGTGILADFLLENSKQQDVTLDLIEPSQVMYQHLCARMSDQRNVYLHNADAASFLSKQPPHSYDVMVLQRSLYAFFDNANDHRQFAQLLHDTISKSGVIVIQEIGSLYDIDAFKKMFTQKSNTLAELGIGKNEINFFCNALQRFNDNVSSGKHLLLDRSRILELYGSHFVIEEALTYFFLLTPKMPL